MTPQANLEVAMLFLSQTLHQDRMAVSHVSTPTSIYPACKNPQQNLLLCLHLPRYIRSLFCGSFLHLDFFSQWTVGIKLLYLQANLW